MGLMGMMSGTTGATASYIYRNGTKWARSTDIGVEAELQAIKGTMAAMKAKYLGDINHDPLDIIYNKTNMLIGAVRAGGSTVSPRAIDYNEFFVLARSTGIIFLFITAAVCLIGMMLTTNSKLVAEKKQRLENMLKFTFLLSSSVTIFSCVKSFFDALLY